MDTPPKTLEQIKREAVEEALERNGGNQAAAARDLDVHLDTIRNYRRNWEIADSRKNQGSGSSDNLLG